MLLAAAHIAKAAILTRVPLQAALALACPNHIIQNFYKTRLGHAASAISPLGIILLY